MLARLQAREALAASTVAAFGSGRLSKRDASSIRRQWERAAGEGSGARRVNPVRMTPMQRQAWAAGLGIQIVTVPAAPAEEPKS